MSSVTIKRKKKSSSAGRQYISGYLCHCISIHLVRYSCCLLPTDTQNSVVFCDQLDNRAAITIGNYC